MKTIKKKFYPDNKKIHEIYEFLVRHHEINKYIQFLEIECIFLGKKTIEDRVISLLRSVYNSQSRPKLEEGKLFFEWLESERKNLKSYESFKTALLEHPRNQNSKKSETIFDALRKWPGWGEKTTALFVKNLFLIKNSPELSLMFWGDIGIESKDIYLPVDNVIKVIFEVLKFESKNFMSINKLLKNQEFSNDLLIWDDLWFWGFITQNSQVINKKRKIGWNPAKYWAISTSPKDPQLILQIKALSEDFVKIIKS